MSSSNTIIEAFDSKIDIMKTTIYSLLSSLLFLTISMSSCANNSTTFIQNNVKKGKVANDTITLGGGCYWCVEAVYERLDGVVDVYSGFSGGSIENPTYEQVCTGRTGHAEVVQIAFDSTITTVKDILEVFFVVHDRSILVLFHTTFPPCNILLFSTSKFPLSSIVTIAHPQFHLDPKGE